MAVPKRKTSKRRKNNRRSHHKAATITTIKCKGCGVQVRPHTICASCNKYAK